MNYFGASKGSIIVRNHGVCIEVAAEYFQHFFSIIDDGYSQLTVALDRKDSRLA